MGMKRQREFRLCRGKAAEVQTVPRPAVRRQKEKPVKNTGLKNTFRKGNDDAAALRFNTRAKTHTVILLFAIF